MTNRVRLSVLGAALALLLASAPTAEGAAVFQSWVAPISGVGTVTALKYATTTGAISIRLTGLTPAAKYGLWLYRGTCGHLGTRVMTLPTLIATSAGGVSRSITLSIAQTTIVASTARSGLAVAVGSTRRCGAFSPARLPGDPDPRLTPGATNPAVTQATIGTTICMTGFTATIRPPSSYTTALKISQIAAYGYPNTATSAYEEDHLIPLEIGGAPRDPRNLWPEPYTVALANGMSVGARVKDRLENYLRAQVCSGAMTLATAQQKIAKDWIRAWLAAGLANGTTPTPTPAPTPPPAPGPTAGGSSAITITSVTSPVNPGATATATAHAAGGASCSITVIYKSGPSSAQGLGPETADGSGAVSWTWTVGSRTTPGSWPVTVTCTGGGATSSATAYLVVA